MKKSIQSLLEKVKKPNVVTYILAFAAIGILFTTFSRAAAPFVAVEPELATLTSGASAGTDINASGGQYVEFGSETTPTTGFDPVTYDWQNNVGLTDPSALTFFSGDIVLNQDGQVLENMEVHGRVTVTGKNVTIRNSKIYGYWYSVLVDWDAGGSLLIEDSEIGDKNWPANVGLAGPNVTARRLNIHSSEDGIKAGANSTYEYMYVHDMEGFATNPHADALQDEGAGNWSLSKCYFDPTRLSDGDPSNASAIIKSDLGAIDNFLIEDCFFGGGNFTLYVFPAGYGCPTNGTIRRVSFAPTARYGLFSGGGCEVSSNYNEWSDNVVLKWSGSSWVTDYSFPPPW